jgi:hypothetical protein
MSRFIIYVYFTDFAPFVLLTIFLEYNRRKLTKKLRF